MKNIISTSGVMEETAASRVCEEVRGNRQTGQRRIARLRAPFSTLVLITLVLAVVAAPATDAAAPSSGIEGVWSFNGGAIAVQSSGNGMYTGTVVAETSFAECTHPIGQQIWTSMSRQPDGSFWGFHQWYFESSGCEPNPTLGPTAWRVEKSAGGSEVLRACFSAPGTSQPTIAANGVPSGVTYKCVSSAPVTVQATSFKLVSLPSPKKCLSLRRFKIHLRDPRNDAFDRVLITLRGHRLAVVRQRNYTVATVDLRGLPPGAFTIKIAATTILGHHISGQRTYHTCSKRAIRRKRRQSRR
jgi:hypothetical protein